jgi:subtilisin family serine protease
MIRRLLTTLAAALLAVLVAPAVAGAAPGPQGPGIIVKLRPGADPQRLRAFGVGLESRRAPTRGVYLLRANDPATGADPARNAALARRIGAGGDVEFAEPNMVGGLLADFGFHAWPDGPPQAVAGGAAAWTAQRAATTLRLPLAQALSRGRGVPVAVIDTGVAGHPALAGRVRSGWDFVDDDPDADDRRTGVDSNRDGVADEAAGHGTFVAGTVALVAPEARLTAYRVLDSDGQGTTYDAAQALMAAADAGAKVVNLSFGTANGTPSRVLDDAIDYARARGAVVVAAAGNYGDGDQTYPAARPGVLSVGALAADDAELAAFSSRGGWVKVAAPGEGIVGPVPGGGFARWSGTSMAAPFVAGQAALVWAANPRRSPAAVSATITSTAKRLARGGVAYGAVDPVASLRPFRR